MLGQTEERPQCMAGQVAKEKEDCPYGLYDEVQRRVHDSSVLDVPCKDAPSD